MLGYMDGNLKKLFNSAGQLYRELRLSEKLENMSLLESLNLLNQHGMLVKRPFLLAHQWGLLGFNEAEWSKKINS
jgi:arsenate reductase-like glutaredoxin family protein